MKFLRITLGVTIYIASILVIILSILVAASQIQMTDGFQLGHLQPAVKYIREHEKATGVIPTSSQFNEWGRNIDSVIPYSFEGYGYSIKEQCGLLSTDYCIEFWTGEDFVTYYSWQPSMKVVLVNSPTILYSFLLLFPGIAGIKLGKRILMK